MDDNFFARVNKHYDKLSKKQQRLADYMTHNYKAVIFLACIPLGKTVGTSEATVVRLANALGYGSFSEMMDSLKEYVRNEMMPYEKLQSFKSKYNASPILEHTIDNNINVIRKLGESINHNTMNWIVQNILIKEKTILVGLESNTGLTEMLGMHLSRIGVNIEVVDDNTSNFFRVLNNAGSKSFVIAVDFPPYITDHTHLIRKFKEKGAVIFALTDSIESPIYELGEKAQLIPIDEKHKYNIEIYAAVLTFFQLIIYEYAYINYDKTSKVLKEYNSFLREFGIVD